MSTIRVRIRNPLHGYKVGGLSYDQYSLLDDNQKVVNQLNFLEMKANELINEIDIRVEDGAQDIGTQRVGTILLHTVNKCRQCINLDAITAFDSISSLGHAIAKVENHFLVHEIFKHERPKAAGRQKGGDTTAMQRTVQGESTKQKVLESWQRLSEKEERSKASMIAEELGITGRTARIHLKKLEEEAKIKRN